MSIQVSNRTAARTSSPYLSRIAAGLIIVSMLVNGFVPRFAVSGEPSPVLASVLASNSLLLQYFSLTVLPIAIVTTLFGECSSTAPSNLPEKPDENSSNSASEFSLVNADMRSNLYRNEGGRAPFPGMPPAVAFVSSPVPDARAAGEPAFPLMAVVCPLFLFFFLLARSSVNEDAGMIRQGRGIPVTRL